MGEDTLNDRTVRLIWRLLCKVKEAKGDSLEEISDEDLEVMLSHPSLCHLLGQALTNGTESQLKQEEQLVLKLDICFQLILLQSGCALRGDRTRANQAVG